MSIEGSGVETRCEVAPVQVARCELRRSAPTAVGGEEIREVPGHIGELAHAIRAQVQQQLTGRQVAGDAADAVARTLEQHEPRAGGKIAAQKRAGTDDGAESGAPRTPLPCARLCARQRFAACAQTAQ